MHARASEKAVNNSAPRWAWSSGLFPSRSECLHEPHRVRERIAEEDAQERPESQGRLSTGSIVGQSAALRRVLEQARQVATTDSTVLLLGETGTGKELIATHIHELSARHGRAMVRVNCAAIPNTLMESELFGRERGAFTGALARQIGRFELADHSTIFVDEIGDLPVDVQVKLLRVLEERRIERLGSPTAIHVDIRIIAATHRNLEQRLAEVRFVRTCSTGSTCSRSSCRPFASAPRTFRSSCGASSTSSRSRSASELTRFRRRAWRRCNSTPGLATFVSCVMSWSGR